MRIEHTCIRCRREGGVIEIQGGHPALMPMLLPSSSPAMCPKCGGWVHPVKDDEVLPFEFVPSTPRVLAAAVWSASMTTLVWFGLSLVIRPSPGDATGFNLWPLWLWRFLAIGAGLGFLLAWIIAKVPKTMDVNTPHPKGTPHPGEFGSAAPLVLPLLVLVVAFFVYGLPRVAGEPLRSWWALGLIGIGATLLTMGNVLRQVYKHGRRPPASGKQWRFGEEPR